MKFSIVFLFLSQFAAAQWIPTNNGLAKNPMNSGRLVDVSVLTSNDTVLIAGCYQGLYFSKDGGNTWILDSNSLAFGTTNDLLVMDDCVIICNEDGIYKTDLHSSWTNITYDTDGLTNYRTSVLVKAKKGFYAGGYDGVFFSSECGKPGSWVRYFEGLEKSYVLDILLTKKGIFAATQDGVYYSADKGKTWVVSNTGFLNKTRTYIRVEKLIAIDDLLFAGTNSGVFISSDNGQSWEEANNTLPAKNSVSDLFVSGTTVFVSLEGGLFSSNDKGITWENVGDGMDESITVWSFYAYDNYLFAATNDGIWRRPLDEVI